MVSMCKFQGMKWGNRKYAQLRAARVCVCVLVSVCISCSHCHHPHPHLWNRFVSLFVFDLFCWVTWYFTLPSHLDFAGFSKAQCFFLWSWSYWAQFIMHHSKKKIPQVIFYPVTLYWTNSQNTFTSYIVVHLTQSVFAGKPECCAWKSDVGKVHSVLMFLKQSRLSELIQKLPASRPGALQ